MTEVEKDPLLAALTRAVARRTTIPAVLRSTPEQAEQQAGGALALNGPLEAAAAAAVGATRPTGLDAALTRALGSPTTTTEG